MKLNDSILLTLTYSDYYNFPLTSNEVHSRLIKQKIGLKELQQALVKLQNTKQIASSHNYYYLPGKDHLVAKRVKSSLIAQEKLRLARVFAQKLSVVPGVLAIFLTGSLAVQNSTQDDDIDFMLITRPNHLWLTRFLVTLYAELMGIRRHPNDQESPNSLCLNLYLSANALKLPSSKRTLYTAYELAQTIPLYDPHHLATQLLVQNSWIYTILPNLTHPQLQSSTRLPQTPPWLSHLDHLLYLLQKRYMQGKITREVITQDVAFFHPQDREGDIIKSCSTLLLPLFPLVNSSTKRAKRSS